MNDMLCSATLPSWTNFNVEVQLVGQERQCPWLSPVPENRASYPVCFPAGFHFGDSADLGRLPHGLQAASTSTLTADGCDIKLALLLD